MHTTEWRVITIDDILERVENCELPASFPVDLEDIDYIHYRLNKRIYGRIGRNKIHFSKDPDRNKIWVYER